MILEREREREKDERLEKEYKYKCMTISWQRLIYIVVIIYLIDKNEY
jgi:hypothetical protein